MPELTIREFAAMGGRACQASRTPAERSEAARRAVTMRWLRVREAERKAKQKARKPR